jgi:segregation and condensation protein A
MYRVQLQNFEGPLDLLLFFIRRDELDIYDIPIAYITDQFLEYIQFMEELDLGLASEFIYMASLLMSIKAKMMLPRQLETGEEPDESDPRFELVQSLLEYRRFKEMGGELKALDLETRQYYRRGYPKTDAVTVQLDEEPLKDVSLFDLISAYSNILNSSKREKVVHKVEMVRTNIEEQTKFIVGQLRLRGRLSFLDLCADAGSRMIIIVTFLAVLEMVREQSLILFVGENSTDFAVDLPGAETVLQS